MVSASSSAPAPAALAIASTRSAGRKPQARSIRVRLRLDGAQRQRRAPDPGRARPHGQAQQRQHRRGEAHRQPLAPGRLAPLRPPLELALGREERAVRVARGRAGGHRARGWSTPDLARQPGEDQHEQKRARVLLEVIHRERAEGTGRCRVRDRGECSQQRENHATATKKTSSRLAFVSHRSRPCTKEGI